jgi:2-polyprenyl-3-methyl-5-hydroxy-6-metoxy-1,4-benzoquinol methylase
MKALGRFLKRCDVQQGRTLIVGSKIHDGTEKEDRRRLYADAVGVDMEFGEGVDFVADLEEDLPDDIGTFEHIECTSVLEHSRRPWLLCAHLQKMLAPGGTLLVVVPWVWRIHNYPGDYFRYTPQGVASLLPEITWERERYIVEDKIVKMVPRLRVGNVRYIARSELAMFGRK